MRRCKTQFSVVSLLAQFLIQSVNPRARHPPRGHAPDQTSSSLLAHSDLIKHKGVQILLSPKINQSLRHPNSFSSSEAIRVPALQEGAGLVKLGQLAHNTCWRRTRTTSFGPRPRRRRTQRHSSRMQAVCVAPLKEVRRHARTSWRLCF